MLCYRQSPARLVSGFAVQRSSKVRSDRRRSHQNIRLCIRKATKKASKVLTSPFDDGYSTLGKAEIVRELTKQGRLAGGSNKDANTLANKSFDMMSQFSKMGYVPELSKEAIVKAIYNRD